MKATFKKHPRGTGLASVGYPHRSVDIKHKKRVCGTILAPNWRSKDDLWRVSFDIVDGDTWKSIMLKAQFTDEQKARDWVSQNLSKVHERYTLYFHESE